MMLIVTSPWRTEVFLARIVMPFSRSRSLLSMISVPTSWLSRKVWLCFSRASTSVVLPWSTWAMIATLRMSCRRFAMVMGGREALYGLGLKDLSPVGGESLPRSSRKVGEDEPEHQRHGDDEQSLLRGGCASGLQHGESEERQHHRVAHAGSHGDRHAFVVGSAGLGQAVQLPGDRDEVALDCAGEQPVRRQHGDQERVARDDADQDSHQRGRLAVRQKKGVFAEG